MYTYTTYTYTSLSLSLSLSACVSPPSAAARAGLMTIRIVTHYVDNTSNNNIGVCYAV